MAAHQIPREKFVSGEGVYTGERKWVARVSETEFEIVPAELPLGKPTALGFAIMTLALMMAAFMANRGSYLIAIGVVMFGVITTVFSIAMMVYEYRAVQRRGPVFRFNRKTGEISLPDCSLTFGTDRQLRFEFIISPFYSPEGNGESDLSELQLVTEAEGKTERYVPVKGLGRNTLMPLVTELHHYVNLPIREIEHAGFLTPKVYEKMFGQD